MLEPKDGIMGVGSGGAFASGDKKYYEKYSHSPFLAKSFSEDACCVLAAARALADVPGMDAEAIATKAMNIAADMCVYTNHNFIVETIDIDEKAKEEVKDEPLP